MDDAQIARIMARDYASGQREVVQGWKEIALLLGMNERSARYAYATVPALQRAVWKSGGRYLGDPGMVALALAGHRSARRAEVARGKTRTPSGTFKKKPAAK